MRVFVYVHYLEAQIRIFFCLSYYMRVFSEQSNKSIPLQSYTFPQKSAVLLGNEKFGVPGDLLEFCSTHLEIPQAGIIRSLNVHVAASLLVWEYSKQNVHTA